MMMRPYRMNSAKKSFAQNQSPTLNLKENNNNIMPYNTVKVQYSSLYNADDDDAIKK